MSNNEALEVTITNQSFDEAGGVVVFPDLEMGGIIRCSEWNTQSGKQSAFENVNKLLEKKAGELGCSHIFCARYEYSDRDHPSYNNWVCTVYGTGYKHTCAIKDKKSA